MFSIEPFISKQKVGDFDCGHDTLNNYLRTLALQSARKGYGATYLAIANDTKRVIGYYTVASGTVKVADVPNAEKLMPSDVPAVRLGRLAVACEWQGQGVGTRLLLHACKKTLAVAELIGVCYLEVHTQNERARDFYLKYGFEPFLDDHMHMFIESKILRELAKQE